MELADASPLNSPSKFPSAVQISRPASASKPGSSSLTNSHLIQMKVAKLVLKPSVSAKSSLEKCEISSGPKTTRDGLKLDQNSKQKAIEERTIKYQQTAELEMKTRKAERERKALNQQQQHAAVESSLHKSAAMDEASRNEAREYMKKQREKRKLETKKEVDTSFVIKQRLDELQKTTRNVIAKKPKQVKSRPMSPPKDLYSLSNIHTKEIKVLRLKKMPERLSVEQAKEKLEVDVEALKLPEKTLSPIKKPASPVRKPSSPLQIVNRQLRYKPEVSTRPSSAKENKKPLDDLKLKVPDVKLSMTTFNRTEVLPAFLQQSKVPFWLQNTAVQPYPYNFIWAVRKKLEAFTSAMEAKQQPLVKPASRQKKARKFQSFLTIEDSKVERPIIADDSGTSVSEANTISEISSLQSDLAMIKSKSQEKEDDDGDDTTISESIFHSLKDDAFVGKQRESVNSMFDRASFDKKVVDMKVSPNTTEKRDNFLSSTKELPKLTEQNDLDNNKLNQAKEQEYQKMLTAFQESLSQVIQVNQKLSSDLSKSSSRTSGTVRNYSSSFENNIESDTAGNSNISEMIENLVQRSVPPPVEDPKSGSNTSIETFIEDSKSTTLKPEVDDEIEDPPIAYNEPAQEFSSSTTKVTTTTTTTEIVQQKISNERNEEHENTLNESKLLNLFKYSESESSFNITLADNNASFGMLMDKSSSEIKSWERTLVDRTRGQIAWLELQKQNFRKHGVVEQVSAIKKKQRAILLRLDKERSKLKENSEKSLAVAEVDSGRSVENLERSVETFGNESEARENIEKILQQREQKIIKRRAQVEHLINWQHKLDREEEKLKQMERDLLTANTQKLSSSPRKKNFDEDLLNSSIKLVKSIDKSLMMLETIEPTRGEETVEVSGSKLNKLWHRLTGFDERKFPPTEIFHLSKQDLGRFYEDAKEVVLHSDLKMLLETSALPQPEVQSEDKKVEKPDEVSDVSTMNSIANIETEEEYAGSNQQETEPETTTENDEDLHRMLANQMKVFLDQKSPTVLEAPLKDVSTNATFQVRPASADELDKSAVSSEMELEPDSLIQTEPIMSYDNSAVDADGSIIPEVNEIQITDMDQDDDSLEQQIEDISFPSLDLSTNESAAHDDGDNRNDLSTITECTEYEQSQGSSNEEISSEIASSATASERTNSEIEKRLISINDSLEEVNDAFKKIAIVNQSPSIATYSTDKDFVDSLKASTSESSDKSQNLLMFSPIVSEKTSGSQISTSTPKTLMPDILSEVSDGKKEESDDF